MKGMTKDYKEENYSIAALCYFMVFLGWTIVFSGIEIVKGVFVSSNSLVSAVLGWIVIVKGVDIIITYI